MKVISPVIKAETEKTTTKQKKPVFDVILHLKSHHKLPIDCHRMDIRRLWDDYHYRINYWGNSKIAKNSGLLVESEIILSSIMVAVKYENGGYSSQVM